MISIVFYGIYFPSVLSVSFNPTDIFSGAAHFASASFASAIGNPCVSNATNSPIVSGKNSVSRESRYSSASLLVRGSLQIDVCAICQGLLSEEPLVKFHFSDTDSNDETGIDEANRARTSQSNDARASDRAPVARENARTRGGGSRNARTTRGSHSRTGGGPSHSRTTRSRNNPVTATTSQNAPAIAVSRDSSRTSAGGYGACIPRLDIAGVLRCNRGNSSGSTRQSTSSPARSRDHHPSGGTRDHPGETPIHASSRRRRSNSAESTPTTPHGTRSSTTVKEVLGANTLSLHSKLRKENPSFGFGIAVDGHTTRPQGTTEQGVLKGDGRPDVGFFQSAQSQFEDVHVHPKPVLRWNRRRASKQFVSSDLTSSNSQDGYMLITDPSDNEPGTYQTQYVRKRYVHSHEPIEKCCEKLSDAIDQSVRKILEKCSDKEKEANQEGRRGSEAFSHALSTNLPWRTPSKTYCTNKSAKMATLGRDAKTILVRQPLPSCLCGKAGNMCQEDDPVKDDVDSLDSDYLSDEIFDTSDSCVGTCGHVFHAGCIQKWIHSEIWTKLSNGHFSGRCIPRCFDRPEVFQENWPRGGTCPQCKTPLRLRDIQEQSRKPAFLDALKNLQLVEGACYDTNVARGSTVGGRGIAAASVAGGHSIGKTADIPGAGVFSLSGGNAHDTLCEFQTSPFFSLPSSPKKVQAGNAIGNDGATGSVDISGVLGIADSNPDRRRNSRESTFSVPKCANKHFVSAQSLLNRTVKHPGLFEKISSKAWCCCSGNSVPSSVRQPEFTTDAGDAASDTRISQGSCDSPFAEPGFHHFAIVYPPPCTRQSSSNFGASATPVVSYTGGVESVDYGAGTGNSLFALSASTISCDDFDFYLMIFDRHKKIVEEIVMGFSPSASSPTRRRSSKDLHSMEGAHSVVEFPTELKLSPIEKLVMKALYLILFNAVDEDESPTSRSPINRMQKQEASMQKQAASMQKQEALRELQKRESVYGLINLLLVVGPYLLDSDGTMDIDELVDAVQSIDIKDNVGNGVQGSAGSGSAGIWNSQDVGPYLTCPRFPAKGSAFRGDPKDKDINAGNVDLVNLDSLDRDAIHYLYVALTRFVTRQLQQEESHKISYRREYLEKERRTRRYLAKGWGTWIGAAGMVEGIWQASGAVTAKSTLLVLAKGVAIVLGAGAGLLTGTAVGSCAGGVGCMTLQQLINIDKRHPSRQKLRELRRGKAENGTSCRNNSGSPFCMCFTGVSRVAASISACLTGRLMGNPVSSQRDSGEASGMSVDSRVSSGSHEQAPGGYGEGNDLPSRRRRSGRRRRSCSFGSCAGLSTCIPGACISRCQYATCSVPGPSACIPAIRPCIAAFDACNPDLPACRTYRRWRKGFNQLLLGKHPLHNVLRLWPRRMSNSQFALPEETSVLYYYLDRQYNSIA